ncbi:ty3-gypsy retrotransposon protein [Cucumis melo var. makuwa]|uniref:Ty3-gypsy retrotransposon protein n=1 Tax=Cucumis melo var. makuwa TaxID=1194695 RepID=A0A5D3CX94_CUCMM|nr:ty3-gypsy retrotransposon protein [Cucumis melo var. makuwa]TYK14829.1 ty3-gypsy retrotransposon protein [Cucumis melo var. makuwa]
MSNGYQPPKFQQFDRKGNPKQHVDHFIETYETAHDGAYEHKTKKGQGEPVIDYINRWRSLSLDYMLKQLLENQPIQLPKCKRPEQAGKIDDPNYCKYHRVISHPIEKCFMLKELILKLAHEKNIKLDIDEVAQSNHVRSR